MNYYDEYRGKLRTPEEAVKVVKSGDWVDLSPNITFPVLLEAALAKRQDELFDVKIRSNLIFHRLKTVESDPERKHFIYNSWHCSNYERQLCDRGLCNFIPMIFRNLGPYYRRQARLLQLLRLPGLRRGRLPEGGQGDPGSERASSTYAGRI